MANEQPIVISYLKLTPDEQPFFRIKDLFEGTIVQKLNHLTIVLAASQDPRTSPEIEKILTDLRKFAEDRCLETSGVHGISKLYATNFMLKLVDQLVLPWNNDGALPIAQIISPHSGVIAGMCEEAAEGLERFYHEVQSAIRRISEIINKGNTNAASLVFTPENAHVVEELVQAARDICTLLRQIKEYYLTMKAHFRDPELLQTGTPSEEEIDFMRKRWTAFAESLQDLNKNWGTIMYNISRGLDFQTAKMVAETWNAPGAKTASSSKKSDIPLLTGVIADSLPPGGTPPEAPETTSNQPLLASRIKKLLERRDRNSNQPEPPAPTRAIMPPPPASPGPHEASETPSPRLPWTARLRAMLRRLMSCLSFKNFT